MVYRKSVDLKSRIWMNLTKISKFNDRILLLCPFINNLPFLVFALNPNILNPKSNSLKTARIILCWNVAFSIDFGKTLATISLTGDWFKANERKCVDENFIFLIYLFIYSSIQHAKDLHQWNESQESVSQWKLVGDMEPDGSFQVS